MGFSDHKVTIVSDESFIVNKALPLNSSKLFLGGLLSGQIDPKDGQFRSIFIGGPSTSFFEGGVSPFTGLLYPIVDGKPQSPITFSLPAAQGPINWTAAYAQNQVVVGGPKGPVVEVWDGIAWKVAQALKSPDSGTNYGIHAAGCISPETARMARIAIMELNAKGNAVLDLEEESGGLFQSIGTTKFDAPPSLLESNKAEPNMGIQFLPSCQGIVVEQKIEDAIYVLG